LLRQVLCTAVKLASFLLIARILLDWLLLAFGGRPPKGMVPVYGILYDVTEPVMRPARRLLRPVRFGSAGLDLSPMLLFAVLFLVSQAFGCGTGR
jgi:YggT family protein